MAYLPISDDVPPSAPIQQTRDPMALAAKANIALAGVLVAGTIGFIVWTIVDTKRDEKRRAKEHAEWWPKRRKELGLK